MSRILGIPTLRMEILRFLSQHPEGATSGDAATALGTRYQTVQRHLDQLEDLGAVTANVAAPRRGHHVIFQIKADVLDRALDETACYLRGE